MSNEDNGHKDDKMEEIAGILGDEDRQKDTISNIVSLKVSQCGALLRQQLERKAKLEPLIYDQDRVEHIMRHFEVSSADVEAAITQRVTSRLTAFIQLEVMRVLEDAVSDGSESLENPVYNHNRKRSQPTIDTEPPPPQEEQRNTVEEVVTHGPQIGIKEEESNQGDQESWEPPIESQPEALPKAISEASPSQESEEQDTPQTSDVKDLPDKPPSELGDGVYEGTVKLRVQSNESLPRVVGFVDELRRNSDVRLLQLVGNYKEGVRIWVGLRAPLHLKNVLLGMKGVSRVDAASQLEQDTHEPVLSVRLAGAPTLN